MKIPMNEKCLIVFDLDGTLLTSKNEIADSTKEVSSLLQSQGHLITLASGRAPRAIMKYYKEMNLNSPLISYNGSLIYHPLDKDYPKFTRMLPKEIVLNLLYHFGESFFKNVMIESMTDQYYLKENHEYVYFFYPEGMNIHIGSVLKNLNEDVFTFVLELPDSSKQAEVREYMESVYPEWHIRYWLDADNFGELYTDKADKGKAITELARRNNIDKDHIIVFGDAMNDASMMKAGGVTFTMKNGSDSLKKLSKFVTEYDNDHDGISIELKKLFSL